MLVGQYLAQLTFRRTWALVARKEVQGSAKEVRSGVREVEVE